MNNLNKEIRLAGIVRESITDGPGIRFSVFVQGCPHHCQGCHNEETWDFDGGQIVTVEKLLNEIDKNPMLKGVTLSGGEPLCQAEALTVLSKEIKKRNLDIVIFTGYLYEDLLEMKDEHMINLLAYADLLVDGRFNIEEKDLSLKFRGSKNQRIIDMNKTRKIGKLVLANEYMV